jgi:hypothetical protein
VTTKPRARGVRRFDRVDLPKGWWETVLDLAEDRWRAAGGAGHFDVYTFLGVDRKTIFRARGSGRLTPKMFARVAKSLGYQRPRYLLSELVSDAPFEAIHAKTWQEIPWEDCPAPHRSRTSSRSAPFEGANPVVDHVNGWNVRLRVDRSYEVQSPIGHNERWRELEVLFCKRLPRTPVWRFAYKRGAVTSSAGDDFTPDREEHLVTCWGKLRIDRDAPWYLFEPVRFKLLRAAASVEFHFSSPPEIESSALAVIKMTQRQE